MSFRDSDAPRFRCYPVLEAYGRGIHQDRQLRMSLRRFPEEEGRDAEVEVDEVFGLCAGISSDRCLKMDPSSAHRV